MSYTTYKTQNGVSGFPATALADTQIRPDRGSVNPFDSGARRNAAKRAGHPARVPPGPRGERPWRRCAPRPDRHPCRWHQRERQRGVQGAEGRGRDAQAREDRARLSGAPSGDLQVAAGQRARRAPGDRPGRVVPVLQPHASARAVLANTPKAGQIAALPTASIGGFYSTPNNAYIYGYVDRTIGPNRDGHNVLVLHAKMPKHPHTYNRNRVNDSSGTQTRFWSICNYGSIANPPLIPANSACLFDERVPTDRAGYYTIVVSMPKDRPRNATDKCGVAWMDWGNGRRRPGSRGAGHADDPRAARLAGVLAGDRQDHHPRNRACDDGRPLSRQHVHDEEAVREAKLSKSNS